MNSAIYLLVLIQVTIVAAQEQGATERPAGAVLDMANYKKQKALEFYPWGSAFPSMMGGGFKRSAEPVTTARPAGSVLDMASNKKQKALEFYPWGSAFPSMMGSGGFKRSVRDESVNGIYSGEYVAPYVCKDNYDLECKHLSGKGMCDRSDVLRKMCMKSCKMC